MAQRICQQDRIVSLTPVRFCRDILQDVSNSIRATFGRQLKTAVTHPSGQRRSLVVSVFGFPPRSSKTLSLNCGKQCEKSMRNPAARTHGSESQSFNTRVFTPDQRLPTPCQHTFSCYRSAQQLSVQGDLEPTNGNHQNRCPLLSSKTVIKYSSHQVRGRTTTSTCFKRTAP